MRDSEGPTAQSALESEANERITAGRTNAITVSSTFFMRVKYSTVTLAVKLIRVRYARSTAREPGNISVTKRAKSTLTSISSTSMDLGKGLPEAFNGERNDQSRDPLEIKSHVDLGEPSAGLT